MPISWKTEENHIYHSLRGTGQNLGAAVVVDSSALPGKCREQKISPKFIRPKFGHGGPHGDACATVLGLQDLLHWGRLN